MKKPGSWLAALALGALATLPALRADDTKPPGPETSKETREKMAKSVHEFSAVTIDGRKVDLSAFRDQVLMVVNVASL